MSRRLARADELDALRTIEVAAGRGFAEIGMAEIAADEPPPVEELAVFQGDGRAWVHVDEADRPVGYLLAEVVDGAAHIEQVSVHPDAAGQGIGRGLIEHLAGWAAERGCRSLTLTTFAEVPWNAPYYQRLGFRVLAEDELGPGLRRIRAAEAEHGLDRWPRVAMIRPIEPAGHG